MKNIIFIITDLNFGGGGERVVANMANYFFKESNYNVEIISLGLFSLETFYNIESGIKIKYLNIKQKSNNKIQNIYYKIKTFFSLKNYLKSNRNKSFVLGIGTYPNILLSNINYPYMIRIGCEHNSYKSVNKIWSILRILYYKKLNAVVSLTQKDRIFLSKISKYCYTIPNARTFTPIIIKDFSNKKARKQLLAIGRLSYQKGYNYLLDIFEKLSHKIPDWNLCIIGEGPLEKWLNDEIKKRKLKHRICLMKPIKEISKMYIDSSIYIMTSRFEGFPMVLLEAQSFGLPIVSFDCDTGPRDIIHNGIDGFLVKPYDINEMANRIEQLIKDKELRKRFGINAIKNSDNFSDEKIYSIWEKLFKNLQK